MVAASVLAVVAASSKLTPPAAWPRANSHQRRLRARRGPAGPASVAAASSLVCGLANKACRAPLVAETASDARCKWQNVPGAVGNAAVVVGGGGDSSAGKCDAVASSSSFLSLFPETMQSWAGRIGASPQGPRGAAASADPAAHRCPTQIEGRTHEPMLQRCWFTSGGHVSIGAAWFACACRCTRHHGGASPRGAKECRGGREHTWVDKDNGGDRRHTGGGRLCGPGEGMEQGGGLAMGQYQQVN